MLFNSLAFLLFFPAVCIVYYIIPAVRYRNLFLLAASYWFYMNWKPVYALLLLTSTVITWAAAMLIQRSRSSGRRRIYLTANIFANITILFLFKYYSFAADTLTLLLERLGIAVTLPAFTPLLPVGISFYIFQALGYSIDVYRGDTAAEKNFFTYALFVSFFPQLVAGPIERSTHLLPQFGQKHRFDCDEAMSGIRWMVWGYFLKLVVADRCGIYVDAIFNHVPNHNGGSYLLAVLLFPFQIYGDFAGYSLIAIGAARIMGFRIMENFRRPYLSVSVTEFWRRWHISLSTWFKDYIYIPLGGSRAGSVRTILNLMVTFAVSGLWHGADWTFIIWGLWHGAAVCIERIAGIAQREKSRAGRLLHRVATLVIVWAGYIFFRANTVGDACMIFRGLVTDLDTPYVSKLHGGAIAAALTILLLKELKDESGWSVRMGERQRWVVQHLAIAGAILYILMFGVLNNSQFIYFQF